MAGALATGTTGTTVTTDVVAADRTTGTTVTAGAAVDALATDTTVTTGTGVEAGPTVTTGATGSTRTNRGGVCWAQPIADEVAIAVPKGVATDTTGTTVAAVTLVSVRGAIGLETTLAAVAAVTTGTAGRRRVDTALRAGLAVCAVTTVTADPGRTSSRTAAANL